MLSLVLKDMSENKIKVLYIDEISRISGGENWFLNFVDGLMEDTIEPVLLCPEGPFADAARSKGIQVIPYNFRFNDLSSQKFRLYLLFGLFRVFDAFAIGRIAKSEEIDIIHSVNTNGHVVASLIRKLFSLKAIWHIHRNHKSSLYRYFRSDYIIFVAKFRKNIMDEISQDNNEKQLVIYNGIDSSFYSSTSDVNKSGFQVGYVGRLTPEKGVEEFVSAASLISKEYPEVQFSIYGEELFDNVLIGKYTETIKSIIKTAGLDKRVSLKGFVVPQTKIYANLSVFFLPSYMEACPMVILEAMAAGVPVIATEVGGIPEIVEHGVTGYLIPPKDPQAIADAVEHVINNPEEVKKIVENARRTVKERFDFRENARQFVKIYQELLDEQR